jgi:hypothetical protein
MTQLGIPRALRALPRWVIWRAEVRDGRVTKVPYMATRPTAHAAVNDPSTWGCFADAVAAVHAGYGTGIGIVLGDELVGVDLDHVRDAHTGLVNDEFMFFIVKALNSYTEVSPSGTGLHVLARGSLPPGGRRRGAVEMYDAGRFFTVTGRHVPGTPWTLEERTAALAVVHARYLGVPAAPPAAAAVRGAWLGDRRRPARPGPWCPQRRQVCRSLAGRHVSVSLALRGRPRSLCHAALLDRGRRRPNRPALSGERAHAAEMGCFPWRRDVRRPDHRLGARGPTMSTRPALPATCRRPAGRTGPRRRTAMVITYEDMIGLLVDVIDAESPAGPHVPLEVILGARVPKADVAALLGGLREALGHRAAERYRRERRCH